jgi:putative pyruvate formate lyase activating enzyme
MRSRLAACDLCPRRCGVDRTAGQTGYCRTTDAITVAHAGLHRGEEPPLSGTAGSGTVFFTNCNLRCVFCQNYQISQCSESISSQSLSPQELAQTMLRLQAGGAHNINLVSPTHVVAQVAEAMCLARRKGLVVPFVYNTNAYDSLDTLRSLDGLVDIYLPDIKYSENVAGEAHSDVTDYVEISQGAIAEMYRQVGNLTLDDQGVAERGLLVRHLILPNDVAGSRASLDFLASLSTDMVIGLMSQYSPQFRAHEFPRINRRITASEYAAVVDYAWSIGLHRCLVQATPSNHMFFPDFGKEDPFNWDTS